MPRTAAATDFNVPVEGVGDFSFGRRRMSDELKIQVEYARIIEGVEPTAWLQAIGGWISTLRVLTVRAPDGWNVDELDPFDSDSYMKLKNVFDALSDKERSFRLKPPPPGEGSGA